LPRRASLKRSQTPGTEGAVESFPLTTTRRAEGGTDTLSPAMADALAEILADALVADILHDPLPPADQAATSPPGSGAAGVAHDHRHAVDRT